MKGSAHETTAAPELKPCHHCGQFSPQEFCCSGCKVVYALIQDKGLGSFYEQRKNERLAPVEWNTLAKNWSRVVVADDIDLFRFHVDGLTCSACVWILERLEQVNPGIEWSRLDMSRSVLVVKRRLETSRAGPPRADFQSIAQSISQLGFKIEFLESESDRENHLRAENRRELIRVGIVGALTGNVMLFSVSLYGGADGTYATGFRILMGLLSLPIVTWGAAPLYRNTLTALRSRQISLDLPIALAVAAGAVAGWTGIFTNRDTLFFDSVSMLVFLLQSSRTALRFLRQRLDPAADQAPLWMHESVPTLAGETVAPEALRVGQRFSLSYGMRLPVDAKTLSPATQWDFSVLNGESKPVVIPVGSEVPAGASLVSENSAMETVRLAGESRVATLVREWRNGPRTRPSLTALADRVGQVFTIVVLATAAGVVLSGEGWIRALTLLVVSCPCVFGIAIPFAESLAMKRAQSQGLLVREPTFFERLLRAKAIFLDKTGTLTTGRMSVVDCALASETKRYPALSRQRILELVAWMEKNDPHPVARALCEFVQRERVPSRPFSAEPSRVPSGGQTLRSDGVVYKLVPRPDSGDRLQVDLKTSLYDEATEQVLATFTLGDELRTGAQTLVRSLLRSGLTPQVLSGDQPAPVAALVLSLGLSPNSGVPSLLPAEKAQTISSCETPTLMIGDGANDAEAFRVAGASIAVRGDFSQCLESADAVLLANSLDGVTASFTIAKRLRMAMILSLSFATAFNLISAGLAVTGHMSPLIAATLMPISSLIVTGLSMACLYIPAHKGRLQ